MLVYDITKRQSFDHIPRWLEELRSHADKNLVIMLIGNKSDLEDQRSVSTDDAKEFAQKEGLFFLETSAMQATNVDTAFITVLTEVFQIINKKTLMSESQPDGNGPTLSGKKIIVPGPAQEIPKSKTCCSSSWLSSCVRLRFQLSHGLHPHCYGLWIWLSIGQCSGSQTGKNIELHMLY